MFAVKRNGPNLSYFQFLHTFLWSAGVLWYQLACVQLSMSIAAMLPTSEFNYFHYSMQNRLEKAVVIH